MGKNEADKKADLKTVADCNKAISLMEPLLVTPESRFTGVINDLTVELAAKAAGFRRSLPEGVLSSLADLVRSMNCYYSNLIEGHDTHPVDIERALQQDYSSDTHKRNLQLEARAHINVQAWIDQGGLTGRALTMDGIRQVNPSAFWRTPAGRVIMDGRSRQRRAKHYQARCPQRTGCQNRASCSSQSCCPAKVSSKI